MERFQSPIHNMVNVSFEFFPPKTDEAEKVLWDNIKQLEPLNPTFVSVTYGAGGSTRGRTHNTVKRIRQETGLNPAAHLTCVGSSKAEIEEIVRGYIEVGVNHIVALRGDPPSGDVNFKPHPDGYKYSTDLVAGLKKINSQLEISVAAFPEKHPESQSIEEDLDYLKAKEDAGATRAITQYFLDPYIYVNFLEKVRKRGIKMDVVPGVLLISNYNQLLKFSKMCGASVPPYITNLLQGTDETPHVRDMVVTYIIAELCRVIRKETGIDHIHFYTLNRAAQTIAACKLL
ncbi:MAG TPA: methylenetetrahydrofolate reductase [NAD(P)H] [Alphaproteobacteria bacterium]|nr:methylenetetrahydrofolate reductase [NAD(P)H] [Alphaproteobacteria bacterium]